MDGPGGYYNIMLSELSHAEKDKYSVITYMWNLKNKKMNITKQKQTCRYREEINGLPLEREKGEGQYSCWGLRSTSYYE